MLAQEMKRWITHTYKQVFATYLGEAVIVVCTKGSMGWGKRKQLLINPIEQCNGTWLVQRRGDKTIAAKIRNDAEDRSLNE